MSLKGGILGNISWYPRKVRCVAGVMMKVADCDITTASLKRNT